MNESQHDVNRQLLQSMNLMPACLRHEARWRILHQAHTTCQYCFVHPCQPEFLRMNNGLQEQLESYLWLYQFPLPDNAHKRSENDLSIMQGQDEYNQATYDHLPISSSHYQLPVLLYLWEQVILDCHISS